MLVLVLLLNALFTTIKKAVFKTNYRGSELYHKVKHVHIHLDVAGECCVFKTLETKTGIGTVSLSPLFENDPKTAHHQTAPGTAKGSCGAKTSTSCNTHNLNLPCHFHLHPITILLLYWKV